MYKYISTTLDDESRDVLNSNRLDGRRRLMALIASESETYAKIKILEDDKWMGKTTGQGVLYTDRKCFENWSAISLGLIKCLTSTSN
jgi:hypothetical protein